MPLLAREEYERFTNFDKTIHANSVDRRFLTVFFLNIIFLIYQLFYYYFIPKFSIL